MDTKDNIMTEALSMFSDLGYDAVSIRDIAKAVGIKESSIYYHFKNKQAILDSIIDKFENYIAELIELLNASFTTIDYEKGISNNSVNDYYFEKYLFDPFCNQVLRFITIEQFHNIRMEELYERYMFELPYKYQVGAYEKLADLKLIDNKRAHELGNAYYNAMTTLTYKYLLKGEMTEEKKQNFLKEANVWREI